MSNKRLVIAVASLCALILSPAAHAVVSPGDKPALEFKAANGGSAESLAKYKGKIIVVDFWATWCGPCMAEADHMVKLKNDYGPKGMQMVGISLDKNIQQMLTVSQQKGFAWPQYCDGANCKPANDWGVDSIPRTFILSPEGSVLWTGHPSQIDAALADAFKNHAPRLVDAKVLAGAVAVADKIEAALKSSGGEAAALKLLAQFPAEAKADADVAARLKTIEAQLDAYGTTALAEVDPLIADKKYVEAAGRLGDLSRALGSLPTGAAAKKKLAEVMANPETKAQIETAQRNRAADAELAIAAALQADKKDDEAYLKFKAVAVTFAGTPGGTAAKLAVTDYETKRPEIVRKAADTAIAGKAKAMIGMAKNYEKAGRAAMAKQKYADVIAAYPGTTYAKAAEQAIKDIDAAAPK